MDLQPGDIPPVLPPATASGPAEDLSPGKAFGRPWGIWATIGLTLLIGLGCVLAQSAVVVAYLIPDFLRGRQAIPTADEIGRDGLLLALATIFSAPVGAGLCALFARLRRGIRVRDYLGLYRPGLRTAIWFCLVLAAYAVASDLVTTRVMHQPLVPDVMVDLYRNARVPALLWLAIVVAGPIAEEFIFRGFLFTGLLGVDRFWWRAVLAITATSGAWAMIHLQYDAYGMGVIFFGGIVLGYARLRTGSLLLCILLHAIMNFLASVQVALLLK
jgi:hypothetical protein